MKERPILFSGPMVRAIIEGQKTQTRRVINQQPKDWTIKDGLYWPAKKVKGIVEFAPCPHGVPGDRLWVRETWSVFNDNHLGTGREIAIFYWSDGKYSWRDNESLAVSSKKKPSIHMPRWASRITLEITDARVQRVQEITADDVIAEGVDVVSKLPVMLPRKLSRQKLDELAWRIAQHEYSILWNSVNAKQGYGWDANPWVWAITFKVIK